MSSNIAVDFNVIIPVAQLVTRATYSGDGGFPGRVPLMPKMANCSDITVGIPPMFPQSTRCDDVTGLNPNIQVLPTALRNNIIYQLQYPHCPSWCVPHTLISPIPPAAVVHGGLLSHRLLC